MTLDFGELPPEVNSARMYSGPGSGSLLGAAEAWDVLAAQLRSTASSYSSAISGLTSEWRGPSSTAMAAAAAPYAAWLRTIAAQAEQTAGQARTAATAYETAFAATVPPPVIAANRAALAVLVATNIVGQNTAAIAATEAQYVDMWAQDAAAMYGYAGQSAAAAQMTPFSGPAQTTEPDGVVGQAVAQSAASAQPASAVTTALQGLATPSAVAPTSLSTLLTDLLPVEIALATFETTGSASLPSRNALASSTVGFALANRGFTTGELPVPLIPGVLYPPVAAPAVSAAPTISAGLGEAGTVSALSVPPSWARAVPAVRLAATVLQGVGPSGLPITVAGEGTLLGQMGLAGLVGGTASRAATKIVAREPDSSSRPDLTADRDDGKTSEKLTRVLAELSEKPESVQHWHTDKAHLESLLEELSQKPGVHAVHVSSRHKPDPSSRQPRWG